MRISSFIGKILYPRQQRWERRRNVKSLLFAVSVTLVILVLVGLVFILKEGGPSGLNSPLQSLLSSHISN